MVRQHQNGAESPPSVVSGAQNRTYGTQNGTTRTQNGSAGHGTHADSGVVYHGTVVHSTDQKDVDILEHHALGVKDGKIIFLEELPYDCTDIGELKRQHQIPDATLKQLPEHGFMCAGFIDTHIHAPQYAQTGTNLDLPLLEWLNKYTLPLEASYHDLKFAKQCYQRAVKRTISTGTTTALYFATIHVPATLALVDIIGDYGQRAYVGKVNMDRNSPENYVETTAKSLADTKTFVEKVIEKQNPLVTPVICPRFAPTCTDQLLSGLGELVQQYKLPVTSHICESRAEVQWVSDLFPNTQNYTDVYHKHGLLTDKTVMAHGVYLNDDELSLFRQTGAAVSHCANSNASLRSGCLDLRRLLDNDIKVGLGTDVSGGYSASMLDAQRLAVVCSNLLSVDRGHQYSPIDWKQAYRLATLGGARAMGLDSVTGNFEVGKDLDALLVDPCVKSSPFDVFQGQDGTSEILQKFLHLGDDRNITEVLISGRSCKT